MIQRPRSATFIECHDLLLSYFPPSPLGNFLTSSQTESEDRFL